ncbi:T9SS type A sorting domain-containing protein [Flavobacterium sp. 25HG05S-40]|uniref:T9SS type A sorting domain-containing protein n=1 Tax=Flavobacterium sp. 25HG05S-40 TaxID=3458682 RepID=UPI004043F509
MKKNLFMAIVALFFTSAVAQKNPDSDYDELDKMLGTIDTSKINTGILYERTLQLANLYNFNLSDSLNTADYSYFKQAILELCNASKSKKFIHSKKLEEDVESKPYFNQSNAVQFGIINTDFNILASWEGSEYQGVQLDSVTQKYSQVPNKAPFYMLHTTVIAPLKNAIEGESAEFIFNNDFMYSYGEKPIKSLTAFFDYGKIQPLIIDGVFSPVTVNMNYETTGTKLIRFEIVYNDGSSVITNSSIYFRNSNMANNVLSTCNPSDVLREDFSTTSSSDFKGYRTNDPKIIPKFDYRVYYSTGNTLKKLMKPIVIIDGFDPGDKRRIEDCDCEEDVNCAVKFRGADGQFDPELHRSITDMIVYYQQQTKTPLLGILRNLGYDVMIVNFPKYTTTNIENGQQVTIDGGAYYIESNALTLIQFINETNAKLAINGSTNHIAIIAPSMAGQISRYALSTMEKNNIPHNVNLWVSIDSPHLGANIPMGDQGLIYRFQTSSDQAIDFYQKELSSPASQQQLIEFHRQVGNNANPDFQDAQTISQGMPQNRGNSFYQEHYNKQNNNGLPNSHGWPQNLRKIAIVNGSLTGSKEAQNSNGEPLADFASDGELVLSIRGFQKIRVFGISVGTVHVASIESRFLPNSSTPIKISRFHKTDKDRPVFAGNINSRGNMDNVPGGYFDAQDQLRKSVFKVNEFADFNIGLLGTRGYWSLREFNPIHSFIPTFSAIAHLEPNQNWNNAVNYNLVCPTNRKTPFDSYFGGDKNTQHTSFTKESVDWLLKELSGLPQLPVYPLGDNLLSGPESICLDVNTVYTFNNPCKFPSVVTEWIVSPNLEIVSQSNYSISVKGIENGEATIVASFQNGMSTVKTIFAGGPTLNEFTFGNTNTTQSFCLAPGGNFSYSIPELNSTDLVIATFNGQTHEESTNTANWMWQTSNALITLSGSKNKRNICTFESGQTSISVRARNACGWSDWYELPFEITALPPSYSKTYTVFPNPSNNVVNIDLADATRAPQVSDVITGELFDLLGFSKGSISILNNKATFSVSGLNSGIYIVKIFINGVPESHQIAVP